MNRSPQRNLMHLILLPALLIGAVAACTNTGTNPPSPTPMTLSSEPLRLDPCSAVPQEQWSSMNFEVRIPNEYAGSFINPQPDVRGCLMKYAPDTRAEFYLQATNMTGDYLRADRAGSDTIQQVKVGDHDATLTNSQKYPGQCMLLVSMSDYRLLLDGPFPNQSCDVAIDLATKLVALPQLQ